MIAHSESVCCVLDHDYNHYTLQVVSCFIISLGYFKLSLGYSIDWTDS